MGWINNHNRSLNTLLKVLTKHTDMIILIDDPKLPKLHETYVGVWFMLGGVGVGARDAERGRHK